MPSNLSDIGNKAKRTELYRKQKGDKKAEQKNRRKRRAREAQELGEVGLVTVTFSGLGWCLVGVNLGLGCVRVLCFSDGYNYGTFCSIEDRRCFGCHPRPLQRYGQSVIGIPV